MRRFLLALVLLFTLTSCSVSPVALIEAVIAATEIAIADIPNIPPQTITEYKGYLDGVLAISTDLLNQPKITTASLAKAVSAFNSLVVPVLPISAKSAAYINAVSNAVLAFVNQLSGATVTAEFHGDLARALVPPGKTVKLSDKDKKKLDELKARAQEARAKLRRM